jgi:hypothetical protein
MRGMCNRMVHDDAHVDLAMVFRTVKQDFPPLQAQLWPLLAQQTARPEQQTPDQAHDTAQEPPRGEEPAQE